MNAVDNSFVILLADDDKDDQLLARDALDAGQVSVPLRVVDDGVELLQYLRGEGRFTQDNPWPGVILLDLNMPRMDGREVLAELKADRLLRLIPVVVFTTSTAETDKLASYQLGAASYLAKPASFQELVELMQALGRYWADFVQLPDVQGLPQV